MTTPSQAVDHERNYDFGRLALRLQDFLRDVVNLNSLRMDVDLFLWLDVSGEVVGHAFSLFDKCQSVLEYAARVDIDTGCFGIENNVVVREYSTRTPLGNIFQ